MKGKYQPGRHVNKTYDWALITLILQVLWFKIIKNRINNSVRKKGEDHEQTIHRWNTNGKYLFFINIQWNEIYMCLLHCSLHFQVFYKEKVWLLSSSGGKTLKILKYKIKLKNVNLVISKLNEWVGRGGVALGHCVPGAQWALLENCEQRRPSQRKQTRPQGEPTALGAEVESMTPLLPSWDDSDSLTKTTVLRRGWFRVHWLW